jgi:ABC-2 type transport system ATP-binding protein
MDGLLGSITTHPAFAPRDHRASAPRDHRARASLPAPAAPLLTIVGLTNRYAGNAALADVGFTVDTGQVLGLIGPNGAGKTTLLEAVAGLLPVDSGQVAWAGELLPVARRREHIFYLPDGVRPYAEQSTAHVISFFADVYRRPAREIAAAIASSGLGPGLHKHVHALSKGFTRRLILAIGLLAPHPMLLMDEPFDGLDLRQTREIAAVLRREAARPRTLVMAIHQLSDAERVCDRFVLLADGRVCGAGTLSELRARTGLRDANLEAVFLALT